MWQMARVGGFLKPDSQMARVAFYGVLAGCAFVANGHPIRLSNGADMLPGTFFVLVAALTGGLWPAVGVSLAGGMRTYLMWGHYWAIPIMVLEGAFVAARSRSERTPVTSILLYWSLLGVPLVVAIYRYKLGLGVNFVWMIGLADVLSGILGAIAVHILFSVGRVQAWGARFGFAPPSFSLRSHIWVSVLLFGILPLLFLLEYAGRQLVLTREREAYSRLQEAAELIEREMRGSRRGVGNRQLDSVADEGGGVLRLRWSDGSGDGAAETRVELEDIGWSARRKLQPLLRVIGFDSAGKMLFVYPQENFPDEETLQNITVGMAGTESGTFSFQRRQKLRFAQSRYLGAVARARSGGFMIVATQPASFAGSDAATLRDVALAWLTGTILLSMILGAWFSVQITRSLQSLVEAMGGAAAEDGVIPECPATAPPEVRLLWTGLQNTQRRLAGALADQRTKAREAMATVKEKSAFMAAVSHELRGPMHSIQGAATFLSEGTPELNSGQAAEMILRSSRHLISILDDIGDFSRLEANTMPIRSTRFPLAIALTELLAWVRAEAESKGIELGLRLGPNVPFFVYLDRIRLVQILFNLVQNAVKFTDRGTVCLTVQRRLEGQEPMVEFRVEDTGTGIPTEFHGKVFEPFFQRATQPANPRAGSGLGLAIVKRLVTAMRGTVTLTSEPGRGTTVCVCLPSNGEGAPSGVPRPLTGRQAVFAMGHSMARETLTTHWEYLGGESRHEVFDEDAKWQGIAGATVFLGQDELPEEAGELEKILQSLAEAGANRVILVEAFARTGLVRTGELAEVGIPVETIAWPPVLFAAPSIVRALPQPGLDAGGRATAGDRPLRVLVAEDNQDARLLLEVALRKLGHSVTSVGDGSEVMGRLRESKYDVLLVDIEMPILGGLGVIELIRKEPGLEKLPVYAVTAHSSDVQRAEFLAVGFSGHLPKPFTLEQLDGALRERTAAPAGAEGGLIDEGILNQYLELLKLGGKEPRPAVERILGEVGAWVENGAGKEAGRLHQLCGSTGIIGARRLSARLRRVHGLCQAGESTEWESAAGDVVAVLAETRAFFAVRLGS